MFPASLPGCPYLDCADHGPQSVEIERAFVEFNCPVCGGVVVYMGVTPPALECDTPGCVNYKLR